MTSRSNFPRLSPTNCIPTPHIHFKLFDSVGRELLTTQMYVQDGQIIEAEDAKGRARILSLGGKIVREEDSPPSPG